MTGPKHRPKRSRRLVFLAGASALTLMVAGCSGGGSEEPSTSAPGGEPVSGPSPGGSSEASTGSAPPSPSASGNYEPATSEGPAKNVPVPEMPEAVKEPTEEGLEAAVEYWWEAGHYLQLTGEADPFQQVSAEECVVCDSLVDNFDEIYGSGGWSTGAEYAIEELVLDLNDDGTGSMITVVREGPTHQYRASGEEYVSEDAEKSFRTHWTGYASYDDTSEQWVIEELIVQSDSEIDD